MLTETRAFPPPQLPHAAADEQSRQLHRQPRRPVPPGSASRRPSSASRSIRALPATEVLYDEKGAVVGVATGDMGVGRDGKPTENFTRGMELRGKYTFFAEGARGSLTKQLHRAGSILRATASRRSTASASRSCGRSRRRSTSPASCSTRSAGRSTPHRRRLVPLPLRREPGFGRLRAASQLREPVPVAVRRVPALQDASGDPRHVRGRQAHRLRRARHHRGRLAVDPGARLPRRRAHRLRGRLHERAAHQGQPQRHPVGHRRRRGGVRGDRRGPRARSARRLRGERPLRRHRARLAPRAQRQAAVVALRHLARRRARRRRHVAEHVPSGHRPRLHAEARQARLRDA